MHHIIQMSCCHMFLCESPLVWSFVMDCFRAWGFLSRKIWKHVFDLGAGRQVPHSTLTTQISIRVEESNNYLSNLHDAKPHNSSDTGRLHRSIKIKMWRWVWDTDTKTHPEWHTDRQHMDLVLKARSYRWSDKTSVPDERQHLTLVPMSFTGRKLCAINEWVYILMSPLRSLY